MEVSGKIKEIQGEIVKGTFKSKNIVVTTDEQYPQHILVQFVQDKCDVLNNFNVGESVKIDINLRGREWTNPQGEIIYFNTIQGWRISKLEIAKKSESAVDNYLESKKEEPSDLPF